MNKDNPYLNQPKYFPKNKRLNLQNHIYLGTFIDSMNDKYDLGIHKIGDMAVGCIVFGNDFGDYFSGEIMNRKETKGSYNEKFVETIKRAKELNYI